MKDRRQNELNDTFTVFNNSYTLTAEKQESPLGTILKRAWEEDWIMHQETGSEEESLFWEINENIRDLLAEEQYEEAARETALAIENGDEETWRSVIEMYIAFLRSHEEADEAEQLVNDFRGEITQIYSLDDRKLYLEELEEKRKLLRKGDRTVRILEQLHLHLLYISAKGRAEYYPDIHAVLRRKAVEYVSRKGHSAIAWGSEILAIYEYKSLFSTSYILFTDIGLLTRELGEVLPYSEIRDCRKIDDTTLQLTAGGESRIFRVPGRTGIDVMMRLIRKLAEI
ncbi:MAG: hypothetical protein IKG46_00680 [Solobacterium sp.]|nr:hypothetical protein [Solobacterium sp.]